MPKIRSQVLLSASLMLGTATVQGADIRKCSIPFAYKKTTLPTDEIGACLFSDKGQLPTEVIIIASSSPVGSAAYNHDLSQQRATAIKQDIAVRSPTTKVRVENVGASTHLMQNSLIYAFYDTQKPTQQLSTQKASLKFKESASVRQGASVSDLGTSLSFAFGQSTYHFSEQGRYLSAQFALDKNLAIPKFSENVFLTPGLSFSYLTHPHYRDLEAAYAKVGIRARLRPLQFELAALGGFFTNSDFKNYSGDGGGQAELSIFLTQRVLLKLAARRTRAFTGSALALEFTL